MLLVEQGAVGFSGGRDGVKQSESRDPGEDGVGGVRPTGEEAKKEEGLILVRKEEEGKGTNEGVLAK